MEGGKLFVQGGWDTGNSEFAAQLFVEIRPFPAQEIRPRSTLSALPKQK